MNVLKNKILQLRKDNALSWETWADLCGKTVESLKKQVTDDANPTLATLIGIVAPFGATIEVLTADEREMLAQSVILQDRVEALEKLLSDARADRDELDRQISMLSKSNETMSMQMEQQQRIIARLETNVEKKEESISRKDAVIAELLRKAGVIG